MQDRQNKYKMALAIIYSILLGIQVFIVAYAVGGEAIYSAASGAGAAGLVGLAWPHLPDQGHAYISVLSTSMTPGVGFLLTLQLFLKTGEVVTNILNNSATGLFATGSCIMEEGKYSIKLIKRSLIQESDVKKMIKGISTIAKSAQQLQHFQEQMRLNLEENFF